MSSGFPVTCSSDELFSDMLRILDRLVGFDTTSHRSNAELIGYVQSLLARNGMASELQWNDDRSKANLVATTDSATRVGRGIIWSGHTDVVPVDGQDWASDPFRLRLTGDTAIGRGSADMKGFIACCLAVLSALDHSALATPITLVLTCDEEVGCLGAHRLVPDMATWADHCLGCVVGEPTGMNVVVGHKGKQNYRARFTGEPRHAALAPEAANPITAAAEFAVFAQALNERFRSSGPHDQRFGINHSWINVGRVEGGVKANIVPDVCTMEFEIRAVPEHSCDEIGAELTRYATGELLTKLRTKLGTAAVDVERLSDTPWFAMDESHDFVKLVMPAFGQVDPPGCVPFGTEAGLFWGHAGIPTVVCGPGFITEAHTPNEAVPLDQLRACLAGLQSLPLT